MTRPRHVLPALVGAALAVASGLAATPAAALAPARAAAVPVPAAAAALTPVPAPSTAADAIRLRAASTTPYTDTAGRTWAPAAGVVGGRTSADTSPVARTADDALYQSMRVGLTGWSVPVPTDGVYRVTLHLDENFQTAPGARVFSVAAEGAPVVTDLDLVAVAGPHAAYTVAHRVGVHDGTLDLAFTARKNLATVSALEVVLVKEAPAVRVNAGTLATTTDSAGRVWGPDAGAVGGRWTTTAPHGVAGTDDDALFHRSRVGMSAYRVRVPAPGTYRVGVLLEENYYATAGRRVFGVTAEGAVLAQDLDLAATAGRATAHVLTRTVVVTDGVLDVAFAASRDLPIVSGIQAVLVEDPALVPGADAGPSTGGTPGPTPGPTSSPTPTPVATASPSPSPTTSPAPTTAPTTAPGASPAPTASPSPSAPPAPTATPGPSVTPSPTATPVWACTAP
ncbi:malectin domain-containing carbohydrate-binding protein [Cellulomonas endophytica]|uniref:malectin domain-containing carbohydrate-binding protein n=1 Tax=Cellulomonas endophytica TaxID=2494735 RepID=UPI001012341D|nr:malectin domain-containing carbohydrate-binding protein [Cellulomonas endophytica]